MRVQRHGIIATGNVKICVVIFCPSDRETRRGAMGGTIVTEADAWPPRRSTLLRIRAWILNTT